MYWNLLCEKNNLQLQLSDFEEEKSIKEFQAIIGSFKSKNKLPKSGYCRSCGSYKLIGWGGYGRKVRHMYVDSERVQIIRTFSASIMHKLYTVSQLL